MTRHLIAAASVFAMTAFAHPALAACGERAGMVSALEERYQETLSARGLQSADLLIEIFTSRDTGTYTVMLTRADGISCIISSGTHFLPLEPQPAGIKG